MPQKAPIWHVPQIGSPKSYLSPAPVRPSPSRRGYGGSRWERLRRAAFLRDDYVCCRCGRVCVERSRDHGERPHCDHVMPKDQGGKDELDNLQTLCGSCHSGKTDKDRASTQRRGKGGSK